MVLAGRIAVDAEDASRASYRDAIATLRALTRDSLASASNDHMYVYLQQAVLGFDGDEIWAKELDHVNDGEVDVQCPECDQDMLIDLHAKESAIEPGLPTALAASLHAQALQAGRESVATTLTHLFGRIDCPECGARFNLADHLAGISYP